ncbi:MAG: ribonuclease III, partial [Candidatus Puniceispirillaceae bacterium]
MALGHVFKDRGLVQTALTHASASAGQDYERLEFLGDRVLGLILAN